MMGKEAFGRRRYRLRFEQSGCVKCIYCCKFYPYVLSLPEIVVSDIYLLTKNFLTHEKCFCDFGGCHGDDVGRLWPRFLPAIT